jgi:TRAP-type C4-dicarboxylate transport system substrate-binding protein
LPLLTPSVAEARRLYDAARPAYERALSAHGQKLLFASPWPPSGIWAKRALTSNEALRSLRIRTYDASSAAVMQRAGAQAFNLSFNEVAAKLEAGEINAVLSSGDGGAGRALWKYLPVFTEINYAIPLSLVTVNLAAWNLLDAPARAAITAAAEETQARQWQQMEGRVAQNYARMKENGMQIETALSPEVVDALAAASGVVVEEWLGKVGPAGREVVEGFRKGRVAGN